MPITPYFLSQAISSGAGINIFDGDNIVTEVDNNAAGTGVSPASAYYTDPTTGLQRPIYTLLIPASSSNILDEHPTTTFTPMFSGYGFGASNPPAPYNEDTTLQALSVQIPAEEYPFNHDLVPYDPIAAADGGSGIFIGIDFAQGFASNNHNFTATNSAAREFAIYNNLTHRSCIFALVSGSSFADPADLIVSQLAGGTGNGSLTGLYGWGTDAVPQELRNPLHRGGFL